MTRVQPRKPPTSATLRIGHDRSAKSVNRNPANVTLNIVLSPRASADTEILTSAPAYQTILLSLARNMCSLSDCPQFNRFKLQHTTQNTPSPDARAHSTATAARATRLNSSPHKEHPAKDHPNSPQQAPKKPRHAKTPTQRNPTTPKIIKPKQKRRSHKIERQKQHKIVPKHRHTAIRKVILLP